MKRRDLLKSGALAATSLPAAGATKPGRRGLSFGNSAVRLTLGETNDVAWWLTDLAGGRTYSFAPPIFPIDGQARAGVLTNVRAKGAPGRLSNGVMEHQFSGVFADDLTLRLDLTFRLAPDCPVVRFRYQLHSTTRAHQLRGQEDLRYLGLSLAGMAQLHEVRLSVFQELFHSYTVSERASPEGDLREGVRLMGPIVVGEDATGHTLLVAYEHGSEAPDAFLQFRPTGHRALALEAKKGNFVPGQAADGYTTVWMHAAATSGGLDRMRREFRTFVLRWMSVKAESRKPYLFYNTWNFQERNKWWNGQSYLQSMNPERILAEIDVAHRLGIEVYVMDTGWYEATGDWHVSTTRFPDGLQAIRARLQGYGMTLGLWFNPTAVAVSSSTAAAYRSCVRSWRGEEGKPKPVWETEASYPMCLVSSYRDAFADTLIRVARETGARYFKWDAIGQYGCDAPGHWHGTQANTPEERADSYAFQLPLEMARLVDRVTEAVPDAIIDFDVTEGGRSLGLSFLSAGKYFLINNGPYLFNYDLPLDRDKQNWNLFFYPGPARTWICRSPLTYDRWIPSVLFLTHYLPDDPASSQMVNVASLLLGQNGIWGDLPAVSDAGVERMAEILRRYKMIRDDMTSSYPVQSGSPGSSPEVHEKLSEVNGRGAVVLFATAKGSYEYLTTQTPARSVWTTPGADVRFTDQGQARIVATFQEPGAILVFFS